MEDASSAASLSRGSGRPGEKRGIKKMRKIRVFKIVLVATMVCLVAMSHALYAQMSEEPKDVRPPAVSGQFYPSNPTLLQRQVDDFLGRAERKKLKGDLVALIAPHAGYIYSGQVAAYSYRQLEGLKFDTVILIGPSHRYPLRGVSVYNHGYYKTPLGVVEVDSGLASRIIKEDPSINFIPAAHAREHSLEVQLPFLQRTLRDFRVVPILISIPDLASCRALADAIVRSISGRKVLIVASTDLSHYHSYEVACKLDRTTLSVIEKLDFRNLVEYVRAGKAELCGGAAVMTTLMAAKKLQATGAKILKYANSGDTAGPKNGVVGYGAVVIYKSSKDNPVRDIEVPKALQSSERSERHKGRNKEMSKEGSELLNEAEKEELLRIARSSIELYVRDGKAPEIDTKDPKLNEKMGIFVTLTEFGRLRGCIGYIQAVEALAKAVSQMAIEAATRDPRFLPVRSSELRDIDIEISVLSPLKRIASIDEIELGRHGVVVKRGLHQGVFLPQVAEETGWNKEEFLSHLCQDKAGLPEDAWRGRDLEIYIFTVQKFEESKRGE